MLVNALVVGYSWNKDPLGSAFGWALNSGMHHSEGGTYLYLNNPQSLRKGMDKK
jgi:hypothetical protein